MWAGFYADGASAAINAVQLNNKSLRNAAVSLL